MDFETALNDSVAFTRETLLGRWTRWLALILIGLPAALLPFAFDPKKIFTGTTVHWELIHWDQLAALFVVIFLVSFFESGYLVRIYRGGTAPAEFDRWGGMFVDGVKISVVWLIWILPALILFLAALALAFGMIAGGFVSPDAGMGFLGLAIILILLALLALLVAARLGTMGAIRFARTGSIMEGVNYREILATIRRIGWLTYIVALIILIVLSIIFGIVTAFLSLIPYIGWVIQLCLIPILTVFLARFITRVYDAGAIPPQAV